MLSISDEIAVDGNMLLDREFDPDFRDPNSEEYRQFTEDFEQMVSGISWSKLLRPEIFSIIRPFNQSKFSYVIL